MAHARRLWGLSLLALLGCSAPLREPASPSAPPVAATELTAGVAEVDITPPAGLSLFGYGPEGRVSRGHRGRLRCRSLYVRDRRGESLAWSICDLGAVSGLLHARVAQQLAPLGLGADRLLLSASHTHAGPAHYFGNRSYSGRFSSEDPGFDEHVVRWLSERIATSIRAARSDALSGGEARLSWHFGALSPGATKNRSLEPHCKNARPMADVASACGQVGASTWEVDRRLAVLRVERGAATGSRLIGLFAVVAMHPTTIPNVNELYHADVFGIAARHLRFSLKDRPIAALASGIAGDVSPAIAQQSWAEAERLGRQLAADVHQVSERATLTTTSVDVERSYREVTIGGPELCEDGRLGNSAAGGPEDGRTRFYAVPVAREGARLPEPEGCHGYKRSWTKMLSASTWAFPRFAPMLAARIGGATVIGLPFELTTTPGLQLRGELEGQSQKPVVLLGLSNEYLQYVTSPAEYAEQHYEGASVVFGPGTFAFFAKQARALMLGFADPSKVPLLNQTRAHEFHPSPRVHRLLAPEPERPRQIVRQPFQVDFTRVDMSVEWRVQDSSFFEDDGRETNIAEGALVRIETRGPDGKWSTLTDELGAPVDDTGTSVWVAQRRRRGNYYSAVWQPPRSLSGRFRFAIGRSQHIVRSQEFSL